MKKEPAKMFRSNIKKLQDIRNDLAIQYDHNSQIILRETNKNILNTAITRLNVVIEMLNTIG